MRQYFLLQDVLPAGFVESFFAVCSLCFVHLHSSLSLSSPALTSGCSWRQGYLLPLSPLSVSTENPLYSQVGVPLLFAQESVLIAIFRDGENPSAMEQALFTTTLMATLPCSTSLPLAKPLLLLDLQLQADGHNGDEDVDGLAVLRTSSC